MATATNAFMGSDDADSNYSSFNIQRPSLVVAAIDFGTTYSGYAYCLRSEYQKDHTKVYANESWSASGDGLLSSKTPTTVLFDDNGVFHSFGYEAEQHYATLAETEEHEGWQYFKRFKMNLYGNDRISKTMILHDDQGNSKPAFEVFGASINYLKNSLMERLKMRISNIRVSDVFWVLTIPAIWDDKAKQFMEESAKKAGIPEHLFTLALEPECAAIFCKELEVEKANQTDNRADLKAFDPGSKFLVVDLGGGTADITAHEVTTDGTLKELVEPTGGAWGGTVVDSAFNEMLNQMFTPDVIEQFKGVSKSDDLLLQRTFEIKKRAIKATSKKTVVVVPQALVKIYEQNTKNTFEKNIKEGNFANAVTVKLDKIICDSGLFIDMFRNPQEKVIKHLKTLFDRKELNEVNTVLLVGGFSASEIVRTAITEAMKPRRVILPNEPGLAVVKGAVMYGFNADSISSRKMPYTYGISAAVPFDDKIHPNGKKVVRYGVAKCEDIFKVFIEKGKEVVPGKTFVRHTLNCPYRNASLVTIDIFRSTEPNPIYIDDKGSKKVGDLNLRLLSGNTNSVQVIDIKMMFGKTKLEVEAKEHGKCNAGVKASFDFLN